MDATHPPGRSRDAARSRAAILDAAEGLFAERGFRATTLGDIAAACGLAQGTPSYFFGSKEALYAHVLERLQATREAALRDAFAPVHGWAEDPRGDAAGLRGALEAAVSGYFGFLDANPAFARLIGWEALGAAERLAATPTHGTPVAEAFQALHAVRGARGLADFDPALASVAFVSLCFLPAAHASTFRASVGLETGAPGFRAAYAGVVVDALVGLVTG